MKVLLKSQYFHAKVIGMNPENWSPGGRES
jgi:hypothetical protein